MDTEHGAKSLNPLGAAGRIVAKLPAAAVLAAAGAVLSAAAALDTLIGRFRR